MKKILLLSAVLLGAVSVSQAGVHFRLGLPLPPLPPLPGVTITAPAPVYAPAYSYYGPDYSCYGPSYSYYGPAYYPPVVRFGFGYPYYGHYGHYYRGYGGYYHGGYGGYHGGYRGGYHHHGRW